MNVYIMVIEYHDTTYKIPEDSSTIIGVRKTFQDAWKIVLSKEFENNKKYCVTEEDEKFSAYELKHTSAYELKYVNSAQRRMKEQLQYKELKKQLETVIIDENFIKSWKKARDNYLDQSQYGLICPGYRAYVYESKLE